MYSGGASARDAYFRLGGWEDGNSADDLSDGMLTSEPPPLPSNSLMRYVEHRIGGERAWLLRLAIRFS